MLGYFLVIESVPAAWLNWLCLTGEKPPDSIVCCVRASSFAVTAEKTR